MGKKCRKKKTYHHLNPRSRVPELLAKIQNPAHELIKKIYKKRLINDRKHVAWHVLFSNMFAWEAIEQIALWANEAQDGFKIASGVKQRRNWQTLFGADATPKEAIEIVKRDWWPEFPAAADLERFFPDKKG